MKKLFIVLLILIISWGCQTKDQETYHILIPEVGFENIKVGTTTLKDIIKVYGTTFKTDTFYTRPIPSDLDTIIPLKKEIWSIKLSYDTLGVQFYFRPNKKEIFAVSLVPPFKAKTDKGIILNESTFKDINKIYGDTSWSFAGDRAMKSYNGITFYQKFHDNFPIDDSTLLKYLNNKVESSIGLP